MSDKYVERQIKFYESATTEEAENIVTEILGYTGKRYSEGKTVLEKLRREFG